MPEDVLEERFVLDLFLKLMAVMTFSGAFDQYTGFNPHNFYLYDDPATGRMSYLVWDLDAGSGQRVWAGAGDRRGMHRGPRLGSHGH